jgi:hypothetical protein
MYGIYDGTKVIARFTAPMTVESNNPIFVSDALSLKRSVVRRSPQRWEITSGVEPLSLGANKLFSMLVTKGHSETVQVVMPQNYGVIKYRTSTSVPTATGLVGDSIVAVTENVGIIPSGTFIRFSNHSKIYMVKDDLLNSGNMHIYPQLRVAVDEVVFKHRDDVLLDTLLDTDTVTGMIYEDGVLMNLGTMKFVERI